MRLRIRSVSMYSIVIGLFAILAVLLTPHSASAGAGPGGGGGSNGCAAYNYSTCTGAVWRYYRTSSNAYNIRNVGSGYTTVTGCGSTGGFFAYVLVNRYSPNDGSLVRSWKIGPVDGDSGNRSKFFGGWTKYYLYSDPGDALPVNPGDGMYSWFSAQKAFEQTKSLGQNAGYSWDGGSSLGWFCYRGLDFNLTPLITGTPKDVDGSTNDITVTPTVKNAGPTNSSSIEWRITKFRVEPGIAVPGGSTGSGTPISFYGNKDGTDVKVVTGRTFGVTTTNLAGEVAKQSVGDYPLGTRICFGLSVKPYSQSSGNWRYSPPFCVTITKKPKIQVWGSDVLVGRPFPGSTALTSLISVGVTNQITKQYGSWSEYGVAASGAVNGLASASGYAGGVSTTTDCAVALLTFSNTVTTSPGGRCTNQSSLGKFDTKRTIPDISTRFPTTATTPKLTGTIDLGASNRQGVYTSDGTTTITLSATTLAKKQWVVINAPKATVVISGDIKYSPVTLNSIDDIPQLVIIASRINIESTVTNIDAWLVANGTEGVVNTCRNVVDTIDMINLSSVTCNKQLFINGPVMAKKLYLHRTVGATQGAGAGDPAEIFNLRPDAYLWATARASATGRVQTVYSQELPPRF
ncbi:MAG: hypothetical protein ABIP50_00305 [Candidatus Saccharimonadales bacterium]